MFENINLQNIAAFSFRKDVRKAWMKFSLFVGLNFNGTNTN